MKNILVTGGAGFIGSHALVELVEAGMNPIVYDNLSNSTDKSLKAVESICGVYPKFYQADILDEEALDRVFAENDIDAVIHFAGLKSVGESVAQPVRYYENNVAGTVCLLKAMERAGVRKIVFSSSATVYGSPKSCPISEDFPLSTTNPYGASKLMIESILKDLYHSDHRWGITLLRYFNPIGAHKSGKIGEVPSGIPNNLMPYITNVAVGQLEKLHVFGNDYPTPDGTGVRDYIHVSDLARGHVLALQRLEKYPEELNIYNLGTGTGYSVLDLVNTFMEVTGIDIPYVIDPRRPGDIAECYANPEKAKKELGFEAQFGIKEMCEDAWRWQEGHPHGYED
ncbi:MAG: UDP-glucose 4-epimerase GalE [Clostridia bacterium]|nr:UDP-glucose 4-epimerase GalE [Clostridia bacterium]